MRKKCASRLCKNKRRTGSMYCRACFLARFLEE